jgi:guanyl-specific ribonuclease Sa
MSSKCLFLVKKSSVFLLLAFLSNLAYGQIAGKVFKDMNSNGVQNLPNEIGLVNYKVHAFLPNAISPIVTYTNSDGNFFFTSTEIPSGTKARIEFPDLHDQYIGQSGADNKSNVQFLTSGFGSFASIGLLSSSDYCTLGGLEILTPCYVNGDPLVPGGSAGQDVALVKFPYNASGLAGSGSSPYPDMLASANDIGAVWGTAYQRRGKVFLISAIVRRHSGLGSLGTGGIYKYDDNTNSISPFIDVKTLGINTGDDPHSTLAGNKLTPNTDPNTIPATGKVGIGAMTLSSNEKDLLFVNLFDRKIYSMEVGIPATTVNPSSIKSFAIPNGCGSGDFRPWALTEYQGKIYVGTVCSGESTQNFNELKAIVYTLDVNSGVFTEVFQMPLTYTKGISDATGICPQYNKWNPWTNTFPQGCARFYDPGRGKQVNFVMYPQPILSGIAFDADGSMVLGFMDRFGLWAGYRNLAPVDDGTLYDGFVGGDLLRAQYNPLTHTYSLESNGASGDLTGCGVNNGEGPGGGEFFCNDTWIYYGNPAHNEITNGGVLILPSDGSVISSAMDPVNEIYQSGGLRTFDRKTGALKYGYALYSDVPGTLGKSGGTGDFKATCDPAPIEIGNRVWKDSNFNGVQDPEELGIANVILNLYQGSTLVGTTQSNSVGEYQFNSSNVTGGLKYETSYRIVLSFGQTNITNLGNPFLATSNVGSNPNSDFIDSDANMVGTNAEILVNTETPGITNYSLDFGITACAPYLPTIVVTKPTCEIQHGKIEITSPIGPNYMYSIDGLTFYSNKTVFDTLASGTYKVVVIDTYQCVSDTVTAIVNNAPVKPSKPSLSVLQPSCQMNSGMIAVVSPSGAGYTYSLNGVNFNNTSGIFNGLASGTFAVYVKNSDNCISDTARATINMAPIVPSKPIVDVIQASCGTNTGTISVTSPSGSGFSYSIDGINFTNTSGVFSGLTTGNYTVWVKNSSNCISDTTNRTINAPLTVPTAPLLATIPLACKDLTGSVTVTSPLGSGLTYSINGVTFTNSTGIFSNLVPDTYLVWVKNTDGCISSPASIVLGPAPTAPSKPVLSVTQPTCIMATGTITVTSQLGTGLSYSIDGINYSNSTGIFMGKAPGNYMIWVKNAAGCKDSTSAIINSVPKSPEKPVLSIIPPTCSLNTGVLTVTSPLGAGLSYSIDGVNFTNTTGIFSNLALGGYTVWVKNNAGCSTISDSAKIISAVKPTNVTATSNSPISLGETITLFSNSINGVSYNWAGPNGFTSAIQNPTIVNATLANGGVYTVTVLSADNCPVTATTTLEILASMGDYAWFDQNRNGIQDDRISPLGANMGPELPAQGIILELHKADGTLVAKDTTDANGLYRFNRLLAGTYYLKFDPISYPGVGFVVTDKNKGTNTTLDNDIERGIYKSANLTLSPGQHDPTWDIGFYRAGIPTITDPCICHDIIYDPDELYELLEEIHVDGTPGDTWIVLEQTGMQRIDSLNNTPIAIGTELLPVPGHPGEYKLQFAHDAAVGYSVVVFNGFDTLRISNLCYVPFFKSNVPTDSICAFNDPIKLIGKMLLDGVDVTNGTTKFFVVEGFENYGTTGNPIYTEISEFDPKSFLPGDTIDIVTHYTPNSLLQCPVKKWYQFILTADASCLAQIGDFVWNDLNLNGRQDFGENGLQNILVTLNDSTGNPVLVDALGNSLVGKTTDPNGFYEFKNLAPGTYSVGFGKPTGYLPSSKNAIVADDTKDSDADLITGRSHNVTLLPGEINRTIDAGFFLDTTCVNPAKPLVSLVHPNCNVATGTINVTSPLGTDLTYSIDGVTFSNTTGIFSGLSSGAYNIWVKNAQGCKSLPTSISILPRPISPAKPVVSLTQPTCVVSTGTITVDSPKGTGLTYSLDGTTFTNTSGIFSGKNSGNYIVWVKNTLGCVDSTHVTILTPPLNPSKPILSVTNPTCSIPTGTITVTSPTGTGITYSIDGVTFSNSNGIFNNLPAGNYSVWVKNTSSCISLSTAATITSPGTLPYAGPDKIIYAPVNTATLSPSPAGGVWTVSSTNLFSSSISSSGVASGLNNVGDYFYVYSIGTCRDTAKVSVLCIKPTLTVGNIKCNGATYSVDFYSSSTSIITTAGTISGGQILNIPIGTNLSVKASNGTGCETTLDVISPEPCDPTCVFSNLSVGQPICKGTTYSVSYKVDIGTVTANAGTVYPDSIVNVPIGTYLVVTGTNTVGSAICRVHIAVPSPASCLDECTNPGISVSGPQCTSSTTYSVNYSLISGVSITSNFGTISNSKITNIPTDKALVITVKKVGCADKIITVLPPTNCVPPCNVQAGNDQIVYMPTSTTNLVGSPIGGTWSASSTNTNSSTVSAAGLVTNLLKPGVYNYIYKVGQCSDTVKVTVICVKPTLTVGNIKCNGSSYSVDFYSSSSNIIPSAGTVSGNQIINIPIGTNLSVKALNGTGCETVLDVISPEPCDPTCVFSNLSVGQPICKGTTYSVSYKVDMGSVTANAGTVYGDSIVNVPIGTYLVVTATNTVGPAICRVHIAVPSPASCLDDCTNPGISVSGPICSGNGTYAVNYIKESGVSISSNYGTIVGNQVVNIPISQNLVMTITKPGCAPRQITTTKPTNCVTPCKVICVPITFRKIK